MPHASHRLDLALLPVDPELAAPRAALDALRDRWRARGWLDQDGPGPVPLIAGGFRRFWLDDPGRVALWANQQGGFQVRCPTTGANAAMDFTRGVEAWRRGAPRRAICACGEVHPLEDFTLRPPGGFARFALVFADVGSLDLDPAARAELSSAVGPLRDVVRRVGA